MIADRLAELGLNLPDPSSPGANYVPYHRDGHHLIVTGQLSQWNGEPRFIGKLGDPYPRLWKPHAAIRPRPRISACVAGAIG